MAGENSKNLNSKNLNSRNMNEEAVQRIIQSNNEQLLIQMPTFIPTTVQGLKRVNEDEAQEGLKEIKEA